ncbi:hypothetical protein RND81_08G075600 [Saponaria officinalis]|uniref:CCHC-type domain-containing protein n=1 Tax=Saponaria officinalis TaxID=3572 RepID=A0AAW1J3M3_SAPOF
MSNLSKLDFVALDITGKNYLQWVLDVEIHLAANGLAMYEITSQLTLCGEKVSDSDMLEKTYQTFHGSQLLLSQQYRQRGSKKYSKLTSCLLVAEQNNEILLKNHQSRRGNNFGNYRGVRSGKFKRSYSHQKWDQNSGLRDKDKKNFDNFCNRCGCKGHWSRTCRTRKHFVDLYQQSINNKRENKIEANFAAENDKIEPNFADGKDNYDGLLDVSDFFSDPDGRIDHLIGDGSYQK